MRAITIHSFGDTGGCWAGGQYFWMRGKAEGLAGEYGDYCAELKAAEANRFGIVSEHKLNYAYHLDATAYGRYLRNMAEASGVTRVGQNAQVNLASTGFIEHLLLDNGRRG